MEVAKISPKILWGYNRLADTPVIGYTQVRGHRAEIDSDPRNRLRQVNVRWREGDMAYVVTGDTWQAGTPRQPKRWS